MAYENVAVCTDLFVIIFIGTHLWLARKCVIHEQPGRKLLALALVSNRFNRRAFVRTREVAGEPNHMRARLLRTVAEHRELTDQYAAPDLSLRVHVWNVRHHQVPVAHVDAIAFVPEPNEVRVTID